MELKKRNMIFLVKISLISILCLINNIKSNDFGDIGDIEGGMKDKLNDGIDKAKDMLNKGGEEASKIIEEKIENLEKNITDVIDDTKEVISEKVDEVVDTKDQDFIAQERIWGEKYILLTIVIPLLACIIVFYKLKVVEQNVNEIKEKLNKNN